MPEIICTKSSTVCLPSFFALVIKSLYAELFPITFRKEVSPASPQLDNFWDFKW